MIDDSKRLDQNYLYSITVTLELETIRHERHVVRVLVETNVILYYTFLKPFFVIFGEVQY